MFRGLVLAFALTGCVSSTATMRSFVGQPLQMAMIKHGPPSNAFDMPDGTRAFQWVIGRTYTPPITATQSGNAYAIGNSVNWYQRTQITGGQPIQSECAYTMFARWDESMKAWIFTGFQRPRFLCE